MNLSGTLERSRPAHGAANRDARRVFESKTAENPHGIKGLEARAGRRIGKCCAGLTIFGARDAGTIERGEHWQCGYVIRKGGFEELKRQDIAVLRQRLVALNPFLADRVAELKSWDDLKLLTVAVDRLPVWHKPGLLCIGDSAHAMSPVGGVGINVAIQDAIAAANILYSTLQRGVAPPDSLLAAVQRRREPAVKLTQAVQVFIQNRVISNVLRGGGKMKLSWIMHLFIYFPWLARLPARFIGMGFRMERVKSPQA